MKDKETLYARWLSNEITEEELELLRKEGALDDLERIKKATDQWNMPKYDKQASLKNFKSKRVSKKAKVKRIYLQWGAGIAASFLIMFSIFNFYKKDVQQVIIAQHGNTKNLNLIDGSTILVNDGSSITYNKDNWLNERNIELEGEAYFTVEKGTPFVVNTKHGSIEVLGTKFNIRAWGPNLHVECYEGSVKVSTNQDQSIIVQNEAVTVIGGTMNEKQNINHETPIWSLGTSRFYDENINDVLLELERQYDVKITASPINKTFSGVFMHNDLDNALNDICKPLGLQYELSADKKEVVIQ